MAGKIVRILHSKNQFRITIPREIAIESGLYMKQFVEVSIIEKGKLEVKTIELKNAKEKGIPINKS